MATMMANKPAPPHQKLKRPSLPAVQTSMNGALSSRSSPSPLLTSTRPPDGSMQPPSAMGVNGTNTGTSGTGPRASNRRRDSQKPGDIAGRASRNFRVGLTDGQRSAKRVPEPYGEGTINEHIMCALTLIPSKSRRTPTFSRNSAENHPPLLCTYIPPIFGLRKVVACLMAASRTTDL